MKTKTYLAFVGNMNTTFGTPHKVTGRHNIYGQLHEFNTKAERDEFCNEYSHKFNSYPVATNKQEAKSKYFAGCTQVQFEDVLNMLDIELDAMNDINCAEDCY